VDFEEPCLSIPLNPMQDSEQLPHRKLNSAQRASQIRRMLGRDDKMVSTFESLVIAEDHARAVAELTELSDLPPSVRTSTRDLCFSREKSLERRVSKCGSIVLSMSSNRE
jgi:hypothetical protein